MEMPDGINYENASDVQHMFYAIGESDAIDAISDLIVQNCLKNAGYDTVTCDFQDIALCLGNYAFERLSALHKTKSLKYNFFIQEVPFRHLDVAMSNYSEGLQAGIGGMSMLVASHYVLKRDGEHPIDTIGFDFDYNFNEDSE